MAKICYKDKRFGLSSLVIIDKANEIIEEYTKQGYSLTLRQLYYQFVARDLIANRQSEYKRLGSIINDARLAGFIDWSAIEDRTRSLRANSHWGTPRDILKSCAECFRVDRWEHMPVRPEVWIEKDALIGIIEQVCAQFDVAYFSCRGYTSQSEIWRASERMRDRYPQQTVIFHLGDHDPSGIDMSRDIKARLELFDAPAYVTRLALNIEQIKEYGPPPNPTKLTDSRADVYCQHFGNDSWELDALEPAVIEDLIKEAIIKVKDMDQDKWKESATREEAYRTDLQKLAEEWSHNHD